MSETLDERVVRLKFDNAKFEKDIKTTQHSLRELDEQLAFKDGVNGIEHVEASFSHFSTVAFTIINRLTNKIIDLGVNIVKSLSVDNISAGWEKFGDKTVSVATMAAQKIKIAGKEIEDYGEKMGIINDQLEKLNWFTDETSYNFTDMVSNIGKFTAAGRSLDESVNAMMGIANWAALSGQNAATASRAMYQLSQALGKGYVQLIDWKSIQNANMDTEEFREKALEAAVALGELTKEGNTFITKTGKRFTLSEFTESLASKWLTSDVLLNTLGEYSSAVERLYEICETEGITATEAMEKYGDELDAFGLKALKAAQEARTFSDVIASVKDAVSTGWMKSAELVFGDYDEVKITWTELANQLYDMFAESGNFRNEILKFWRDFNGNTTIFGEHGSSNQGAFWNLYDSIVAVRDLIKNAWNDIFNISVFDEYSERASDIASKLLNITQSIQNFTKRVKTSLEENVKLRFILTGVFNVLKIGITIIQGIRYALDPLLQLAKQLVSYFFGKFAALGYSLSRIQDTTNGIETAARKVNDILTKIVESIRLTDFLDKVFDGIGKIFKAVSNIRPLEKFGDVLGNLASIFKAGSSGITGFLTSIAKGFGSIISTVGGNKSASNIMDVTNPLMSVLSGLASIIKGIMSILSPVVAIIGNIANFIGIILQKIGQIFTNIANAFSKEEASKTANALVKFALIAAVVVGAISIIVGIVETIYYMCHGMRKITDAIADAIWDIGASFKLKAMAEIIRSVSYVLLSIAASAAILASVPVSGLAKALVAVSLIFGFVMAIAMYVYYADRPTEQLKDSAKGSAGFGKLASVFAMFSSLAVALVALAASMKIISTIGTEGIIEATISIVTILAALLGTVIALNKFTNLKLSYKKVIALLSALSGSVLLMATSIRIIGSMPTENIMSSISAFTTILSGMFLFVYGLSALTRTGLSYKKLSDMLTSLGASLVLMSVALKVISTIDNPQSIQNGVSALIDIMLALGLFMTILKFTLVKGVNYSKVAPLLFSLSMSLVSIASALSVVASIKDIKNVWSSVGALTVIMAAMVAMIAAINKIGASAGFKVLGVVLGLIGVAAALTILAVSLALLASAVKSVGTIDWQAFGKLALALLTIGLLARGTILEGVQMASLGAGIAALGVGILSLAAGLKNFSEIDTSVLGKLVLAMLTIKTFVKAGIIKSAKIAMIGMALTLLGAALIVLSKGLNSINTVDWDSIGKLIVYMMVIKTFAKAGIIKSAKILLLSVALIFLGSALSLLASGLDDLGRVDWGALGKFAVILAGLLALAVAVGSGSKFIVSLSLALIPLSLSLIALAYGINTFESVSWESIAKSLVIMVSTLAALVIVIRYFAGTYNDVLKMVVVASTLAILGAGLGVMVAAMRQMETISWSAIIKSIVTLAASLALLVITANLIGRSANKLLILGGAVALFGAGLLMTALALDKFATSLPKFLKSIVSSASSIGEVISIMAPVIINSLTDVFLEFLTKLTDFVPYIADVVIVIVGAISHILREAGPDLISALFTVFNAFMIELGNSGPIVTEALGKILFSVLEWLDTNLDSLGNKLLDLLLHFADILILRLPDIVDRLVSFLYALVENLFNKIGPVMLLLVDKVYNFIKELLPKLMVKLLLLTGVVTAYASLFLAGVIALLIASLGNLSKLVFDLVTGLILLLVEVTKSASNILFQAFRTILYNAFNILSNVLVSMVTDIPTLLGSAIGKVIGAILKMIGNRINTYLGGLLGLGDVLIGWGEDISNAASDAIDPNILNGQNVIDALSDARTNISNVTSTIAGYVQDDVTEGMNAIKNLLNDSLEKMGMSTEDKAEEEATKALDIFTGNMGKKITNSGEDLAEIARNSGKLVRGKIGSAFEPRTMKDTFSNFEALGTNITEGTAAGMLNSSSKLMLASESTVLNAEATMRRISKTHSPSELFAEIGRDLVDGLALGINERAFYLNQAITSIMNDTISIIRSAIESDINDEIVIRPVLDLSEISNGANSISSIMSNVSNGRVSLSGNLAQSVQSGSRRETVAQESSSQNGTVINNETYSPVFNITSNDPEEVAREVDIRMQRMHKQATLAKGGVR